METRIDMYQKLLEKMGYSQALSYALSIVIFNMNSHVHPPDMTREKLVQEIEFATRYLKDAFDKQLEKVKKVGV